MTTQSDGPVLSPQESLALLRAEQRRAAVAFDADGRLLYGAWGASWVVGFTAFALSAGSDPVLDLPPWVPGLVLFVGLLAAGIVTAAHLTRTFRGLGGANALSGTLYGVAWPIAFAATTLLVDGLAVALDDPQVHVRLWPAASALVVGMLYLLGGALWRDRLQYVLGAWVALVGGAALFAGLPGQYWVMVVAGGGGFLVAAAVDGPRRRVRAAAASGGGPW